MASAEVTEKPDSEKGPKQIKTQTSVTPDLDSSISHVHKGRFGAVPKDRERKIGHRRVDETGTVTYKKKPTSELMAAIQLGIGQSVGGLSSKPERDLLMQDFAVVQSVVFPGEGSNITPAHHCSDFRFKTYAPLAFRYFRELFNIRPDDFMLSLCDDPLTELSNPGAGGSIFYISSDDEFIIKTAQHKEANFLQKLLPGYYMNLNQNPRTLLPKFYGLYCYQCGGKNIRFVVMNNILPSVVKLHEKYDLKGSTYKRKASKTERAKSSPTLKDLDFMEIHPEGLMLEKDTYEALVKTIQRDCRVLESFKIMDYSLLVGIHNLDKAKSEQVPEPGPQREVPGMSSDPNDGQRTAAVSETAEGKPRVTLARGKSIRAKVTQYSTPMESIQAEVRTMLDEFDDEDIPQGGIPAKNAKGERLLIYLGIIDILQCYRFRKKFEHTMKSMITDGETVSVTRPSFYAERFQKFFTNTVFRKAPSPKEKMKNEKPLKHSPSKRKGTRTASMNEDQSSQPIPGTTGARPDLLMGSATPPPTFAEATSGARPRDKMSPAATGVKTADTDVHRSDRTHFQTIQQQEEAGSRSGSVGGGLSGVRVRYSPLSVSESTPTYTEFTEGTPSYTASSPSCSSDVLDSNIPNLPLERETTGTFQDVTDSPSRAMAASSSTEASYYSAVSHTEVTSVPSPSHTVIVSTREADLSSGDALGKGERSQNSDSHNPDEVRVSVTSKASDSSFSSQSTAVNDGYMGSFVSSGTSEQSSVSPTAQMNVMVTKIQTEETHMEEAVNEIDESTRL